MTGCGTECSDLVDRLGSGWVWVFEAFSNTSVLSCWQVGPWLCVEGDGFGGNAGCSS